MRIYTLKRGRSVQHVNANLIERESQYIYRIFELFPLDIFCNASCANLLRLSPAAERVKQITIFFLRIASLFLSGYDLSSQVIRSFLALARDRPLLLKFASQAAPRVDHRPAVEELRLDADRVPAIHALLGIDALQDDHGICRQWRCPSASGSWHWSAGADLRRYPPAPCTDSGKPRDGAQGGLRLHQADRPKRGR